MKNTKTVHKAFFAWDYDIEELYIEDMSKKGWHLSRGGCFSSTYEYNPDIRTVTRIDYNPEILNDAAEKARYIQLFEDTGWNYLNTTFNGWSYFQKEYVPGTPEEEYIIYTDVESLQTMLKKIRTLMHVIRVFCLGAAALMLISTFGSDHPAYWIYAFLYMAFGFVIHRGIEKLNNKIEN